MHKRLPGRDREYIVYDNLDRPVATGPAKSPFKNTTSEGWLITKYDALNRPVITGWMPATVTAASRRTLQAARNTATTNLSVLKTTTNTTINGVSVKYNNLTWPTSGYHILTVQYYDTYDFDFAVNIPTTVMGQAILQGTTASSTKSLPTGGKTRVLEEINNYLFEQHYTAYDIKGQPVFSYDTNYKGGYTQTETALDFTGAPLEMITKHQYDNNSAPLGIKEKFEYTPQGRLEMHTHTINAQDTQVLSFNQYDGLGQLIQKRVGSDASSNPLQNVDYRYNIRGWLTHINDVNNLLGNGDLFGFKINYNELDISNSPATPLYNGNIAETHWRSSYDNTKRGYVYKYDNLNRLKEAHYVRSGQLFNSHNEFVNYDKNGNIKDLFRTGMVESSSPMVIDQLTYTYANNGQSNKLMKVTDAPGANRDYGFKDDSDGTNDIEDDYAYDTFGNMILDQNKGILLIDYNHLNLPTRIRFNNGYQIEYLYNAAGVKLAKTVIDQSSTTTAYLNGYQYIEDKLQFFPQAEGYVKFTEGNNNQEFFNYIYQYKDHLGNNRMSYTIDPSDNVLKILTEDHYYPFGMKHHGYSNFSTDVRVPPGLATLMVVDVNDLTYKYKFQDQERQDELGLNWDSFKWRNYDYAIGRFMNVDPLSEQYSYQSHYNFAENRVVDGREMEGLEWVSSTSSDGKTVNLSLTVKTVNNTGNIISNEQMAVLAEERASILKSSLGGVDSQGRNVNVSVSFSEKATIIWEFNNSLTAEGVKDMEGKTSQMIESTLWRSNGIVDEVGNTQNNRSQVNVARMLSFDENGMTIFEDNETRERIGKTGAHEDIHKLGGRHEDDPKNVPFMIKLQLNDPNNIINNSAPGTNILPEQRTNYINLIEEQQKQ